MDENKHGFEPKQEFTMGGISWTVIQTGKDWVKCITSDCVAEGVFDKGDKNNFSVSSLRAYLNGEFLRRLVQVGAPEQIPEAPVAEASYREETEVGNEDGSETAPMPGMPEA